MKSILVVEDSAMVLKIIKHVLSQNQNFTVDYAESFAQARSLIEKNAPYFVALVDLGLPDAVDGEVVDYTLEKKIPTIVLTASFDEKKREAMLAKGIVDYVTKEGRYSYELALNTIERLVKNQHTKVLVVDDSSTQKKMMAQLLRLHLFDVVEAGNGVEAIKVLLDNPDTRLLVTDFNMPKMDGFELVKNIRVKYEKSDLIAIGISSNDEGALSAKFIKYGANDFLRKPFNQEEFFCRINHNLDQLELIEKIRDASRRDETTGVYSRSYFFSLGESTIANSKMEDSDIALAVINVDRFSEINERYTNKIGDKVLRQFATQLDDILDRFVVARAESDTFLCLLRGLDNDKACALMNRVRELISAEGLDVDGDSINLTFSVGISNVVSAGFDALVRISNRNLQRAKEAGGDIVFGDVV
jgi:diguanylate cyclase (GGDEF)-like protein